MNIAHFGKSLLYSDLSKSTFKLHNLLHVPSITMNLISVSKFAVDNNVFFEFHPNVRFVKSQVSKETLLQGTLKEGLYQFSDINVMHKSLGPSVFHVSCKNVSPVFELWHKKLGHPSSKIVNSSFLIVISKIQSIKLQSLLYITCVMLVVWENCTNYHFLTQQHIILPLLTLFTLICGGQPQYMADQA